MCKFLPYPGMPRNHLQPNSGWLKHRKCCCSQANGPSTVSWCWQVYECNQILSQGPSWNWGPIWRIKHHVLLPYAAQTLPLAHGIMYTVYVLESPSSCLPLLPQHIHHFMGSGIPDQKTVMQMRRRLPCAAFPSKDLDAHPCTWVVAQLVINQSLSATFKHTKVNLASCWSFFHLEPVTIKSITFHQLSRCIQKRIPGQDQVAYFM